MKILFLCHRFPFPPVGGGKIRALHMIRHLAASGHEVTLCSLIRSDDEARGVTEIGALGTRVEVERVSDWLQFVRMLLYLPTSKPSSFGYFQSRGLVRKIDALLRREHWDLIVAHCSSMAPYVSGARDVPKLLDFADMDSQKWLDYSHEKRFPATVLYALEARKLEREELRLAKAFNFCTTISGNELATLNGYGSGTPSDWFPNGVDLEYFVPSFEETDPDLVVFVGRMDYYPNEQAMRWFCESVWPKLRARRETLKLRIVGANPPRSVQHLGLLAGVEVTGLVPDIRPFLNRASVSIAPLKIARGMQNKVLECMAMGIPVVTTDLVAHGLGLGDESPLQLAATADQYVEQILRIVEQPEDRHRLSAASRALAETEFSWSKAMRKFDAIIAQCHD